MVVQLKPRAITVERGSRGFGLSLIYRGLDKYEEKDTGIFVARVVPGGQAARYGVRENDKILTINAKTPRNVDDAVGVIKQAGNNIKLVVLREEDVPGGNPDIIVDDAGERSSLASGEINSSWVSDLEEMRLFLEDACFFNHENVWTHCFKENGQRKLFYSVFFKAIIYFLMMEKYNFLNCFAANQL